MAFPYCCCSVRALAVLLLISAIPIGYLVSLERATLTDPSHLHYRSSGWIRECAKWDPQAGRFLVSTFFASGLGEVVPGGNPVERTVMREHDVAGNASLGIVVDRARDRVLVVFADVFRNRFGAVGAYRLDSFDRLFLTHLSGPDDEPSMVDDVTVDNNGNAYITDARANKIWKVGPDGKLLSVIRSNIFVQRKEWYRNLIGLNGIVYHPNGYLLVVHTDSGYLFRVDIAKEEASIVEIEGSDLLNGDGLELLSLTMIVVVASSPSAVVVESYDDWRTGTVTGSYFGPSHRLATSATVKDGKVYVSHIFGGGLGRMTHVISEAVFAPASN